MVRDLKHTVLPKTQAWSAELSRITSGTSRKIDQERRMANEVADTKLQLKKDIIKYARNWIKQNVSYSISIHCSLT